MQTLHIKPPINLIHTNKNRIFANEWKLVLGDLDIESGELTSKITKRP